MNKFVKGFLSVLVNGASFTLHMVLLPALMSRNACNGENGETGEKSPAAGD